MNADENKTEGYKDIYFTFIRDGQPIYVLYTDVVHFKKKSQAMIRNIQTNKKSIQYSCTL